MTKEGTGAWRERLRVHPAADVFPPLSKSELRDLADDIRDKGGLHEGVTLYLDPKTGDQVLLDGRNRLDALELLGDTIFDAKGKVAKEWFGRTLVNGYDPVGFVISANIRRRHLTKRQQGDLIVAAVETGKFDRAKLARSIGGSPKGQKGGGGSTKDPMKEKVIAECAKLGISKRTAMRALIDAEPERKRPQPGKTPDPKPLAEVQDVIFSLLDQQAATLSKLGRGQVTIKTVITFGDGTKIEKTARHG